MNFQLITTAIESTWPDPSVPILFLGEWCKLYSRKEKWGKYSFDTLNYHWNKKGKLYADYVYLNDLFERLLKEVSVNLNTIHCENESVEYWRIIIGPWLGYFIQMIWDRYESLRLAFETGSVDAVWIVKIDDVATTANDMDDFYRFFVSDFWNQWIFQEILKHKYPNFIIEKNISLEFPKIKVKDSGSFFRSAIKKVFNWITSFNAISDSYFFISDYLGFKNSARIQLRLKQTPKRFVETTIPDFTFSKEIRTQIKLAQVGNDFELLISKLIPKQILKSYLEGYAEIKEHQSTKVWPQNPKVIFTSNSHIGYDVFKVWAARQKTKGSKLILSQHGGHYGIGKFSFHEDHETKIADRYLTWGWSHSKKVNVIPSICVKYGNKKHIKWNPQGNVLLVQNSMPRYSYWMYSCTESTRVLDYLNDQFSFVSNLEPKIQESLCVKLYPQDYGWEHKMRWKEKFPDLRILGNETSMSGLMETSRVFISTYNATTYLESLSLGIPTLIFWNPHDWEIRDSAKPFFQKLEEVGIFFQSPSECAKQLNLIWDDIEDWWFDEKRQKVVSEFLNQYAKKSDQFVEEIIEHISVP